VSNDRFDEFNDDQFKFVPGRDPTIWVTNDGCEIPIVELSNDHLANTLRFLQRKAEASRRLNIAKLMWYLLPNGDEVESVPHRLTGDGFRVRTSCPCVHLASLSWRFYTHPQFAFLAAEATRRRLVWNIVGDLHMTDIGRDVRLLQLMATRNDSFTLPEEVKREC
jgi:hypothetical protein